MFGPRSARSALDPAMEPIAARVMPSRPAKTKVYISVMPRHPLVAGLNLFRRDAPKPEIVVERRPVAAHFAAALANEDEDANKSFDLSMRSWLLRSTSQHCLANLNLILIVEILGRCLAHGVRQEQSMAIPIDGAINHPSQNAGPPAEGFAPDADRAPRVCK